MSTRAASLADRSQEFTRKLIVNAAVELLEQSDGVVPEVTFHAVAQHANISQRTVFRYFATREEFLDAIADEARARMQLPAPPTTLDELIAAPRVLYAAFEAKRTLVAAGLHNELADRMRAKQGQARWAAVRKIVDALAPRRSARERAIAAANIRYYLAAPTWHYYRVHLGFDAEGA